MEVVSESRARLFKGRVSSADAHDLVPGALQLAENFQFNSAGKMIGRRGLEARTPRVTADGDIIAMTRFDRPDAEWIVWETDEGKVKACKTSDYATVVTLGTGYNTFQPMCFAHDRYGRLYGANGIDRPWRWDGLTATLEPMGIDAPDNAPTIASPAGGSLSAGVYLCAYRYLDDDLSFVDYYGQTSGTAVPSSLSSATSHTAAANDKLEWTGLSASAQARVSKMELWRTTAGQSQTYYRLTFEGVSAGQTYIGHNGSITSSATSGGVVQFTLPAGHGLVVGARIQVTGHSVAGYNANHLVTAVTATTATTNVAYSADGTGGTWQLNGYMEDTQSDAALILLTSMAVETPDGRHPIARRFTPPPSTKPFLTFFQDRLFFAGSIHYTAGRVTTNGTTTLTGVATFWTSTMEGRFVYIEGEAIPFVVSAFVNSGSLTLNRAATTSASNLDYTIAPSPVERNQILWSEIDEPEAAPTQNVLALQENTGDNDSITGLIAHGSDLLITKDRHIYALSYFVQPEIDASIVVRTRRGMLNHRCFAMFEGVLYLMDQAGVYAWNGGTPVSLSVAIQDLWRDNGINFTLKKLFFLHADPAMEAVRCRVNLTTDGSHVGSRWLEYAIRDSQWSTGYAVFSINAACLVNAGGGADLFSAYGGPNDRVLTTKLAAVGSDREGSDYVNAETRGTVSSATASTLTDTTASFTAAMLDAPVALLTGDGKHQIRQIIGRSATELTVSPNWSTTPAEGDVYLIGAIEILAKTGLYTLAEKQGEEYHKRAFRMVYQPLTLGTLDIRRYYDHGTTPETSAVAQDLGTNVTWDAGSQNAVVDIRSARSSLASAAGMVELKFGGRHDARSQADRWVAMEVRGLQGDQRVQLYEFTLQSVE